MDLDMDVVSICVVVFETSLSAEVGHLLSLLREPRCIDRAIMMRDAELLLLVKTGKGPCGNLRSKQPDRA